MFSVDVHIPVRKGGYIPGSFFRSLTFQEVDYQVFVAGGPDDIIAHHAGRNKVLNITAKREKLRSSGDARFIYLADDNIILPEYALLRQLVEIVCSSTVVGNVGTMYKNHVACGSMMIRREVINQIPQLDPREDQCECSFINTWLAHNGYTSLLSTSDGCIHEELPDKPNQNRINLGMKDVHHISPKQINKWVTDYDDEFHVAF